MSQKLQAETHVRARVVVGNGWGRGGAIQDQDGHPLSALALITHVQPTRGKQASPHSSTAAGTDPCWWRSPSRGSMNSVRLENIKILFYLKPELSRHTTVHLLSSFLQTTPTPSWLPQTCLRAVPDLGSRQSLGV